MKLRTILALGGVAALLYAHRRRGGEWTLESLKDSARTLIGRASERASEAKDLAEKKVHEVASTLGKSADSPPRA